MKKSFLIALSFVLLSSLSAVSAPATKNDTVGAVEVESPVAKPAMTDPLSVHSEGLNVRNHDEDWYWGFAFGAGSIKYAGADNAAIADFLKSSGNVDHTTFYFDLRFLWPIANRQTALGVSLGGVVDHFENKYNSTAKIDATYSIVAFSAQHYLTGNIGDGFFLSGDVGVITAKFESAAGGLSSSESSNGLGLRAGVGYSILLSNETRLPLQIQYQRASVSDDNSASSFIGSVGVLF